MAPTLFTAVLAHRQVQLGVLCSDAPMAQLADNPVLRPEPLRAAITCPEDKPQVMEEIRGMVLAGCYPENLWRK